MTTAAAAWLRHHHHTPEVPQPRLDCPVTALTGAGDSAVPLKDTRAWQGHRAGRFRFETAPSRRYHLTDRSGGVIVEIRRNFSGQAAR